MTSMPLDERERAEAARLYRAIADGETTEQLLQRFYDFAGDAAGLRPPLAELNFARLCGTRKEVAHV